MFTNSYSFSWKFSMIKNSLNFQSLKIPLQNVIMRRRLRLATDIKKFLPFHLKVPYFLHKSSVGFGRKVPSFLSKSL